MKQAIKNIEYLLKYTVIYCKTYIPTLIFISLSAFVGPLGTVFVPKFITDQLMSDGEFSQVIYVITFITLITVIRSIIKIVYDLVYLPFVQAKIVKKYNIDLINKLESIDASAYDNPDFYERFIRAINMANDGIIDFLNALFSLVDRFVYISTIISLIAMIDFKLMIFSLLSTIFMLILSVKESNYSYETEKQLTNINRRIDYSKRLLYQPDYIKDVKSYNMVGIIKEQYTENITEKQKKQLKRAKKHSLIRIINESQRVILLQSLSMLYLAVNILNGNLEVSTFVSLFLANIQFSTELFFFVNSFTQFYKLGLQSENYMEFINQNMNGDILDKKDLNIKIDNININNLSFSYTGQEKRALSDISMSISNAQKIGIVGYNGAGKSTLVKILSGLYAANGGKICINNTDYKGRTKYILRENVGILYQDYKGYAFTIAENVLMRRAENEADRQKVIQALKKVDLLSYVESLPKGIDTVLTREFDEKGTLLSGGQLQKLALARIFAMDDKQIIILDEVSGALDPIAEQLLNEQILKFCEDKILIIISHRLSIMNKLDYIYYLDSSKIIESGSCQELIQKDGAFAKMYRAQLESYDIQI